MFNRGSFNRIYFNRIEIIIVIKDIAITGIYSFRTLKA